MHAFWKTTTPARSARVGTNLLLLFQFVPRTKTSKNTCILNRKIEDQDERIQEWEMISFEDVLMSKRNIK